MKRSLPRTVNRRTLFHAALILSAAISAIAQTG